MVLKGGPTQDEIMAISLFKLGVRSGDTVADIGCGTGKVAIAMAADTGLVIAMDRREEAIAVAEQAALNAGASNIEFHCGEATVLLRDIPSLDCAFVGGSRSLETILELLAERVERTIVVNAVLLDTVYEAVRVMKKLNIFEEVVQVQVARSYPLGKSLMFRPIDPVFIVIGSVS